MRARKYILRLFVVLVCLMLPVRGSMSYAQNVHSHKSIDEKDYILLITSYAHDSRQVSEFMAKFEAVNFENTYNLEIKIESLGIISLDDISNWKKNLLTILNRQNQKYLKAILLIGQEAWATYLGLGDRRPNIPFFGTSISDNGIDIPENLDSPATWEPQSISNRQKVETIGYGGAIYYNFDVAANIKLIKHFFPHTQNIALLTDNTYGGVSLHANFQKVMREQFPDIDPMLIDGRQMATRDIEKTISQLPRETVLLLGTWRVDHKGTFFTERILSDFVDSRPDMPVFSLSGLGMRDVAIAGVLPNFNTSPEDFLTAVFSQIVKKTKDTLFMEIPNELNVNMGNFRKMKLNKSLLPSDYKVVDTESEQVRQYKRYLWLGGLGSTLILMMLVYSVGMTRKFRRQNLQLNQQAIELKAAKEQAEISDKLKSKFLANISHEIRTPLNAIDGFSRLVNQTGSIENIKEYLKYITDNTDKLLKILTLIVDIAKADSGIIEFDMTDIDLKTTFKQIRQRYKKRIPTTIHFECQTPYDVTIKYDVDKLEQIITILLDNAIKFTRHGTINFGYFATENGIKIYVTDTGIGIQQKNIPKIFDKFEKLGSSSEGTGIGLALIKTLVEKSGGNIKIVSRPEAGSRFIVELPCERSTSITNLKDYDKTEELLDEETLLVDKQLENPLKILVAEDDPTNFSIIKTILKTHSITHVADGMSAVKAIQNDWFDIILMDIKMPLMDGITATSNIRKFDLSTPIIAVTAFSTDQYMKQAEKAGCDFFIEKPFTRSKLYSAILKLMRKEE